jgi:hypothetical protein
MRRHQISIGVLASVVVEVLNRVGLFPVFHEQIFTYDERSLTTHGFKSLRVPVFHEQILHIKQTSHIMGGG